MIAAFAFHKFRHQTLRASLHQLIHAKVESTQINMLDERTISENDR